MRMKQDHGHEVCSPVLWHIANTKKDIVINIFLSTIAIYGNRLKIIFFSLFWSLIILF